MQREEERAREERGKLSDYEAGGYRFPSCISQEPPCLVGLFGPQKKVVFDRPVLSLINLVSGLVVLPGGRLQHPGRGGWVLAGTASKRRPGVSRGWPAANAGFALVRDSAPMDAIPIGAWRALEPAAGTPGGVPASALKGT